MSFEELNQREEEKAEFDRKISEVNEGICKDCNEKFDLLVGVSSEKVEFKCNKCGSKNIGKVLGSFSVGNPSDKSSSSGPTCSPGTCPRGF